MTATRTTRTATLSLRISEDLKARASAAAEGASPQTSLTALIEWGLELALSELEKRAG